MTHCCALRGGTTINLMRFKSVFQIKNMDKKINQDKLKVSLAFVRFVIFVLSK